MYWRVRNITPEHLMRQYGVHVILIVSVMANVLLIATRPNPKKDVSAQIKTDFDQFARHVTKELLDSSFITFRASTLSLMSGSELAPNVVQQLQKMELLPKTPAEIQATERQLEEERRVSATRIDSVSIGEPNQQGLIPVTVRGVTVAHSAASPPDPHPFTFQFLLGQHKETQKPIVAAFAGQ